MTEFKNIIVKQDILCEHCIATFGPDSIMPCEGDYCIKAKISYLESNFISEVEPDTIQNSNEMEKKVPVWQALDGELFIHKISCTEHNQKVIEKYTYFQNIDDDDEKEWDIILNNIHKTKEYLKFNNIKINSFLKSETK